MEDREIIKALECCTKLRYDIQQPPVCVNCPYYNLDDCTFELKSKALDLFNRLQAEKQNLEIELKAMRGAANSYKAENKRLYIAFEENQKATKIWKDKSKTAKAEAYKEFAEKLHEELRIYGIKDKFNKSLFLNVVDKAKKELVGEDK